jgi:hypothetical protein
MRVGPNALQMSAFCCNCGTRNANGNKNEAMKQRRALAQVSQMKISSILRNPS